ncbi:MAG: tetratricopeptide repeat protein [Bacteroidota bacterium]
MYRYLAFLLSTFLLFNCQSETTSSEETASENSSVPTQNDSDRLQAELNQIKLELRSERTLKNAFRLAEFYEQQQNQEAVNSIYQALPAAYPNDEDIVAIKVKLDANLPNLTQRLTELYYNTSDAEQRISTKGINDYVTSAEAVALIHPQADSMAVHLKRAAESSLSIRGFDQALYLYDLLISRYPDTKESEQALFRTAFIYDNDLGEMEKAKETYQAFINKYPNSEFADDAQFLLQNIGKDDAEILESLLKKQEQ